MKTFSSAPTTATAATALLTPTPTGMTRRSPHPRPYDRRCGWPFSFLTPAYQRLPSITSVGSSPPRPSSPTLLRPSSLSLAAAMGDRDHRSSRGQDEGGLIPRGSYVDGGE